MKGWPICLAVMILWFVSPAVVGAAEIVKATNPDPQR